VVWLGLDGHILFDRRKPGWLLLSVAVILWGLRALFKPVQCGRDGTVDARALPGVTRFW